MRAFHRPPDVLIRLSKPAGPRLHPDVFRGFLFALLLAPITIILHEFGHFAVPLHFDLPAQVHPAKVVGGATASSGAPSWMVAAQAVAGPLVNLVLSFVAALLFRRNPRRLWLLALAVASSIRFLLAPVAYLLARLVFALLGRPFEATPNFDEHNLAVALDLSPVLISLVFASFVAGLFLYLWRKVERRRIALAVVLGSLAGTAGWTAMPPWVLAANS